MEKYLTDLGTAGIIIFSATYLLKTIVDTMIKLKTKSDSKHENPCSALERLDVLVQNLDRQYQIDLKEIREFMQRIGSDMAEVKTAVKFMADERRK